MRDTHKESFANSLRHGFDWERVNHSDVSDELAKSEIGFPITAQKFQRIFRLSGERCSGISVQNIGHVRFRGKPCDESNENP